MNEFDDVISEASSAYGIEPALLKGVLQQESSFKPSIISGETKSRTGAIGIAQFMPATAKEVGIDPTNPIQSIFGAAFYLKKNIDQFGSVSKGLSAYNYGPSNVEKLINKHGDDWVDKLPPETSTYLMKVAGYRDDFSNEFQSKAPQDQSDAQPNGPKLKSAFDNDEAQPAGTLQYSQFSPDIANVIGAPQTNNALIAKAATAKIQGPMRPGPTIDNAIQKQASDNLVGDELSRAADVDKLPASQGNFISDPINVLARGGVSIGETVAEVMSQAPTVLSSYGPFSKLTAQGVNIMQQRAGLDKVFGDAKQLYTEQLSPEQRNASEAKIWDSNTNTFGPALSNPRSYYGGVLESLPGMAVAMGPGMAIGKTAFAEALAKGLSEKAATDIAASAGMKAGMFSQGVLGAGQTGSSVRQETMQLPDSVFDASDKFQELLKSGLSREDAKKSLADDASKLGFVLGAGTGVFGGVGERFMAKAFTGGVAGNLATRIAKGAVSNGILEQLPLSASQQLADNYAKSTVNPNQSLSENVINQGLSGASMGVIMGGATGAMGHAPAESANAQIKTPAIDTKTPNVKVTEILDSPKIDDAINVANTAKQPVETTSNIYDANNPLVDMDGLLASITAKAPDETGKPLYSGDLTNAPTDAIGGLTKVTNTSDLEHPNVYPSFGEPPPPGGGGGDQFATRESLRDPNAIQELPPLNDRRIDTANSKLVADMTPDEKSQALLTDDLTGIPNLRAYKEATRLPVQTRVDLDGFKAINDTFGHEAGDQVLQVVAKHLQDSQGDGKVYRIGGDEFPGEFKNEADAKAAMETARAKLADTKFTFQLPDGTQKEITGIGFSYGTGKDIQLAENALIADKAARKASGLRGTRDGALTESNPQLAERQQTNPSQLADELARARKPVQGETDGEKMQRLASQGESSQVDLDAKQADLVPDKALPDALQKQVDAGTVKATRTEVAGMPVKIEVARDDTRTGTSANGNPYSQKMGAHYGELTGTENANGEPVKTFLGPTADNATKVFVIDQVKADRSYDEPKVMIGYKNAQSARDAYMMNYPRGWKGIGGITEMPMEKFKEWVNSPAAAQPLSEAVRARMPTTTPANANEVVIGSYGSMPSKNNQLLTLKRNGSEYTLFQGKNEAIDGNSGEPITYKSIAEAVADVKAEMSREDRRFLSDRQKAFLTPEFKGENNGSVDASLKSIREENEQSQKEQDAKVLEGVDGSDNLNGNNRSTAVNTVDKINDSGIAKSKFDAENNGGTDRLRLNKSDKPIFYSQMERQIDTLMGKQEPSKELAIKVEAWAKSGKFKADELYASGLTDWLKLQDGKVTKDQVLGFIRDNGVKVQEVMLGTEGKASEAMRLAVTGERNSELSFTSNQWTEQSERFERTAQKWQRNGDTRQAERDFALSEEAGRLAEGLDSESGSTQGMPKFSGYQEPGGKNYKEMLITLPEQRVALKFEVRKREDAYNNAANNPYARPYGVYEVGQSEHQKSFKTEAEAKVFANEQNAKGFTEPKESGSFRSSHFDQPNILAHVRFNERIDADGKRVLFVEEIQSDWAQKGKKEGFVMPEAERKEADALMEKANVAGGIRNLSAEDQARGAELGKRITTEGVPNGPFVGKTEAWVSLAIKRIIRLAADEGFDKVAFVTGEQSASRYDLSKQVDSVNWSPHSNGETLVEIKIPNQNSLQLAVNKDGTVQSSRGPNFSEMQGKGLDEIIGKDLAQKVLGVPQGKLSGDGLKVGGEGMKTFYDKIVPNIANDVIKKLGGDKMGEITLGVGDKEANENWKRMTANSSIPSEPLKEYQSQPGFDITPAMRDKVREGMPLFNKNETNNGPKNETKYQAEPDTDGALKKLISDIEDQTGKAIPESAVERVRLPDQLALEKIAGAFDTRIVGLTDPNNVLGINGATFPEGNVIYLNANSERPHMAVMFHELGHQLEAKNPALYAQLEAAIREQIDQGKYPEFAAKYENMRASDVRGEFVSEFLADAAMTDKLGPFWSAFNKTNRSAFQKVVDFLRQMVDTVRKVAYTNETKAYMKDFDAVLGTAGDIMGKFAKSQQTDTPAFKSWFGDSKVVDANGNPLVVYHGTNADFDAFNTKWGGWFTPNAELAEEYGGKIIVPAYLSINNPYISSHRENIKIGGEKLLEKARRLGHDGILLPKDQAFFDEMIYHEALEDVWIALNPTQIKSATGNNGNFDPKNPDIRFNQVAPTNSELAAVEHARFNKADIAEAKETPSLPDETFFQKNQRIVQDKDVRFKVVQDWLESKGVKLSELADIYTVASLYPGRVAVRQEDFRQQIFSPLNAELQKAGHTLDDVGTILHAQHAEERNIKVAEINPKMPDGGSGMKTADARDIMAKADPELVEIANKIRAITDMTLDLRLQSGEITKERYNQLKYEGYKFYAPLKGGDETVQSGAGKGFDVKSTMKRALGHSFRDEMIVENILRDHEMAIITAEKNRVAQTLLQFAVETNDPNLITIGQPEKRAVLTKGTPIYAVKYEGSVIEAHDNVNDARNAMNKLMFDANQVGSNKWSVAKVTDQGVRYQASPMLAANEAGVYLSGQFVRMQINDPLMARAYLNQGVDHLIGVLKVGKEVNTFLSKAYTGWNPAFIFKNAIRDATEGVINLTGDYGGTTMLKVLSKYPEAFGSLLRYAATGKMTDSISNYRADGGKIGAAYLPDLDRVGQDIRKVYNDYAGVADTLKRDGSFSALRVASDKTISKLTHFIEVANMATENSMRLATYETMRENGMSRNKSALAAKDVTLNFNRKGEIGTQASALWLFFNPSVQGAARSIQTLLHSEHKTQAWALTGAMTLLFYAMAKINASADKERWEQTPDYEKSHNLIIPAGKYQVKIPIPYGYGFFGNLGTAIHELQGGKDITKVGYMLANAFAEGYSPIGNPVGDKPDYKNLAEIVPGTPLKIGAEILANRSGLGGPIVPPDQKEGKPDSTTMFRNTKETIWDKITGGMNKATGGNKAVAGWVDVHPDTLKYLWATATGGTGRFITDSMQIANLTAQGATPDLREVPILRDFLRTQQITDTQKAFMDAVSDSKIAQTQFDTAKKNLEEVMKGKNEKVQNEARETLDMVREKNRVFLKLGSAITEYQKADSARKDEIDAIMADTSTPLQERRLKAKEVEKVESDLYNRYISLFKEKEDEQKKDELERAKKKN